MGVASTVGHMKKAKSTFKGVALGGNGSNQFCPFEKCCSKSACMHTIGTTYQYY